MKAEIINLKFAYDGLVEDGISEKSVAMLSLKKAISGIKSFDLTHRYIKVPKSVKTPKWDASEMTIIEKVCEVFGCSIRDIFKESRKTSIVQARHLCAYILHKEQKLTQVSAGEFIGQDHSSINWSCGVVPRLLIKNSVFITKKNIVYVHFDNLNKK